MVVFVKQIIALEHFIIILAKFKLASFIFIMLVAKLLKVIELFVFI